MILPCNGLLTGPHWRQGYRLHEKLNPTLSLSGIAAESGFPALIGWVNTEKCATRPDWDHVGSSRRPLHCFRHKSIEKQSQQLPHCLTNSTALCIKNSSELGVRALRLLIFGIPPLRLFNVPSHIPKSNGWDSKSIEGGASKSIRVEFCSYNLLF
jgi:hypothetical protein